MCPSSTCFMAGTSLRQISVACGHRVWNGQPPPVLPHHLEKHVGHEKSWYLYIKHEDLPDADIVTCEVKKGGVLWHRNIYPPLDGELLRRRAVERRSALPTPG